MHKLDIILPTYNGGKFIVEQIQSILRQDEPDFVLSIVDDGSDDNTWDLISSTCAGDDRCHLLSAHGNLGQKERLKELVSATSAPFIAIADQDDIWESQRNRKLLMALDNGQAIAFGRSQLIASDGVQLGTSVLEELGVIPLTRTPLSSMFKPLVSAHAAIIRRSWLDQNFFSSRREFDWVMGVAAQLSKGLVYVDDAVVFHRLHANNQANKYIIRSRRLLSRHRLRESTTFVTWQRDLFMKMLDDLGAVRCLDDITAQAIQTGRAACRNAWDASSQSYPLPGKKLRSILYEAFEPIAGSAEDYSFFCKKINSLSRPQFSLVNIAKGLSDYLLLTKW